MSRGTEASGGYEFPTDKLSNNVAVPKGKIPLVIVACGSFSPVTYLHLRMFEMAADHIRELAQYHLIAGYFSPVNDHYGKEGLVSGHHRVAMVRRAVDEDGCFMMVDNWEVMQDSYQRSKNVLDHFDYELNTVRGGALMDDGSRANIQVMLLAGGDLIESFGTPNLWSSEDLDVILGKYGCVIIERTGTDVWGFLLSHDLLYRHRRNVFVVKQLIYNDISSTKVRLFVKRGMSIKYLLPTPVIAYIYANRLYGFSPASVT